MVPPFSADCGANATPTTGGKEPKSLCNAAPDAPLPTQYIYPCVRWWVHVIVCADPPNKWRGDGGAEEEKGGGEGDAEEEGGMR